MKIESIRIKNFRSFADDLVPFNTYTCLVGPNGAGKSTVLCALNMFFRETENSSTDLNQLDVEDFHQKNTDEPVEITVMFNNLSDEAKQDFSNYVRQDKLVVSAKAIFNKETSKAEVKQYGQRLGMTEFMEFFKALGDNRKVSELKEIYIGVRQTITALPPPGTKDAMVEALHTYETERPNECSLLPSEDQFYGVSRGANRLAKYVQWVFVPAVKDASTEQIEGKNTALGQLLARTVRSKTNFDEHIKTLRANTQAQYQTLLDENQKVLQDISQSLQGRLGEWAHPDATLKLEWKQDLEKSIRVEEPWAHIIAGEGAFEGALARFGHGLQRSYLLALLQELAGSDDQAAPTLIFGCEEPELYQHPPQARHLAAVFQKLSESNSQILISTHSPLFVSGEGFEDVRMVCKDATNKQSRVTFMSYADIAGAIAKATGEPPRKVEGVLAKIHQALQPALNEMFFARRLILVEGLEDVAYITAYFNLLGKSDEFRRLGCNIVPVNGKSEMLQPLVIAKHMGISTYVVFDADSDKPDRNGSRAKHEKDNKGLLVLLGKAGENPLPGATLWGVGFVIWHADIGTIVKNEIGEADWQRYQNEADKLYGNAGNLRKNSLHIGTCLALAWEDGKRSASLNQLCDEILNHLKTV
jgi:predicted ATP-dependent endonuclease of OLD family